MILHSASESLPLQTVSQTFIRETNNIMRGYFKYVSWNKAAN